MLLLGKVGLVTGAGDGIGRATALMFARDGGRYYGRLRPPGLRLQ